jgi:hypothetical protein
VLGGLIALALVPFTPPGVPVIAACAAALLGLERRKRSARGWRHDRAGEPALAEEVG